MAIFKELIQVMQQIDPVTGNPIVPDDKGYLLLLRNAGEDPDPSRFDDNALITGRRATFEFIAETLGNYDLLTSQLLSGKLTIYTSMSLYTFMRICLENNVFPDYALTLAELENCIENETIDLEKFYIQERNVRP